MLRNGMMRWSSRALVTVVALALINGAAPDTAPASRFAAQIQTYQDSAANMKNELAVLVNTAAGPISAFTKGDVLLLTKYMNELIDSWNAAAAALEKGDEAAAAPLVMRARELESGRYRWAQRFEARRLQAQVGEYLPACEDSYDWLAGLEGGRQPVEVQDITALMEAKKLRSEAYGRLADATTPTADAQTIYKCQDDVFAADVEVQVADKKMAWAIQDLVNRKWVMLDATVSSPDLTAAQEGLAKWRQEYEATYRRSRMEAQALVVQDRHYLELVDAVKKAYQAAKTEQDRLKQEQKVKQESDQNPTKK
jgi:hypothetical protein